MNAQQRRALINKLTLVGCLDARDLVESATDEELCDLEAMAERELCDETPSHNEA